MSELYHKLLELKTSDFYPMHMPGHKRNPKYGSMENPYEIDITEIPGFDNLHQPEELLRSLSERLSRLYGSRKAYPLVNGSTGGILAGISAAVNRGDQVLLLRNCHKSVYHAVILRELVPIYCYPQNIHGTSLNGGILPENIKEALIKHPKIRLVILTSPTYEGMVSDIKAIADIVHAYGARLLVDEAHGAHFGFHPGFPESAIKQGADLVIQSLHKTLPAFTQTAVLHSNVPELQQRIEKYLAVYESSSPSYVLMAGIDRCVTLLEEQAQELFKAYDRRLERFYSAMEQLTHLQLIRPNQNGQDQNRPSQNGQDQNGKKLPGRDGVYAFDRSKLTISTRNTTITGHQLYTLLYDRYHIVLEMEAPDYVLAMTSICDTDEGFDRMAQALLSIDRELEEGSFDRNRELGDVGAKESNGSGIIPVQAMFPSKAWEQKTELLSFPESAGRISAVFLSQFPPGAPILIPGEIISQELVASFQRMLEEGITITGLSGDHRDYIEVLLL